MGGRKVGRPAGQEVAACTHARVLGTHEAPIGSTRNPAPRRRATASELRALFAAARFDEGLALLRGDAGADVALLAASALLRLGRGADADRVLDALGDDVVYSGDDVAGGRYCLMRARVAAACGDERAERYLGRARAFFLRNGTPVERAELALTEAELAWSGGERASALTALAQAGVEGSFATQLAARHLRGRIAASDLDFATHLACEYANLRDLLGAGSDDVWLQAGTLAALASVAAELDERHVVKSVRRHADRLAWTDATARYEFTTYRHLGWSELYRGDRDDGIALVRRSARVATGDGPRLQALLDRARLARIVREPDREALEGAADLALRIDWRAAPREDQPALLELAYLYSAGDAPRAPAVAALLPEARRRRPATVALGLPQTLAQERYWRGRAAAARGERATAREELTGAYEFWSTVGFAPRATLAALALYRTAPTGALRAHLAERALRGPESQLSEQIARALATPPAAASHERSAARAPGEIDLE